MCWKRFRLYRRMPFNLDAIIPELSVMPPKSPLPPPVHVRPAGGRPAPHGALQAKPAGGRPMAAHVQAALSPAQAKPGPVAVSRAAAAPHVQAAMARTAQPKIAPQREGGARASHVQAATGAAAQPRRAPLQPARVAPQVQARPIAGPPRGAAGGTVQPCGFFSYLWKGLTSCVWGDQNNQNNNFAPLEQEEPQELEIVVQRQPESHQVGQDGSSPLTLNDSYSPGDLTACAMVFVLDANGGGCVYHWPFHTPSGRYLSKMQTAMREAEMGRAVACQIFGRDYGLTNSKRGEYLEGWKEFGDYIQENLGFAPAISLCEDAYSNPILVYTARGIESRFPPFTPLATLMG